MTRKHNPTGPFTVLEREKQEIGQFLEVQKREAMVFEDSKL